MERRKFLQLVAFAFGLLPTFAIARKRKAPQYVVHQSTDIIFDQSGNLGNGAFVIGAFTSANTAALAQEVARLRKNLKYRSRLSHASRDKWKTKYARALIDLWLNTPGAKLEVLVTKDDPAFATAKSDEKLYKHVEMVTRLIDGSPVVQGSKRRVIAQSHYREARQARFERALTARSSRVGNFVYVEERGSDLLQLVDLVVGAVQASQPWSRNKVENPNKRETIAYLATKLGAPSLQPPILHARCSINYA